MPVVIFHRRFFQIKFNRRFCFNGRQFLGKKRLFFMFF